jgi:hypothetical protein
MPVHDWARVSRGTLHDLHLEWISSIKHSLNAGVLPPGYYALAEQIAGGFQPDVLTLEVAPSTGPASGSARGKPGHNGIALAERPPKVRFTASAESERYAQKRSRVAIRHSSDDRIIAFVEIVSPGNKDSRHALRAFVDKSAQFLDAGIHLLVIDLFPPGRRDPEGIHGAIWAEIENDSFVLPKDKPLTLAAYSAGLVKKAYVEPVAVGDPLTDMPLFLEPERYVSVPLEGSYGAAFERIPQRWRDVLEAPK